MILTLEINDDVAKKIKCINILTGKSAEDITAEFGAKLNEMLTGQIMEALGVPMPANLNQVPVFHMQEPLPGRVMPYPGEPWTCQGKSSDGIELIKPVLKPAISDMQDIEDDEDDDQTYEGLGAAESLSSLQVEESEEDLLPETFVAEEDEEEANPLANLEKEGDMSIKNKLGQDVGYEDELMADIQAMADEEDFAGEDDIMADAAASMGSGRSSGARVSKVAEIPQDTPIGESGEEGLDILPVDFGLNSISSNESGGMDFFAKALSGTRGDKSKRNGLSKKRIIQPY